MSVTSDLGNQIMAHIIDQNADTFVLTTDDPGNISPEKILSAITPTIKRPSGETFFVIDDRFEAIRYALFSAKKEDIVIIAGRGPEPFQNFGKMKIPFDDRIVVQEILKG